MPRETGVMTDDRSMVVVECWQCGGDGYTSSCFEEYACVDPEGGCDLCQRRCDICHGKGSYAVPADSDAARDA